MNRQEAARVIEVRQVFWPNTPAPGDAAVECDVWAAVLERFDVDVVVAAMRTKRHEAFAPTVGQIEEAIDPTPTYAVAMEEFKSQMRAGFSPLYTAPGAVPWSHPLIAAFAEAGWWYEYGMSPDASSDPDAVQAEAAFRAHFREGFKGVAARQAAHVDIPALTGLSHEQIVAGPQRQLAP